MVVIVAEVTTGLGFCEVVTAVSTTSRCDECIKVFTSGHDTWSHLILARHGTSRSIVMVVIVALMVIVVITEVTTGLGFCEVVTAVSTTSRCDECFKVFTSGQDTWSHLILARHGTSRSIVM